MDDRVMRAITASGTVPSTTAGRIRWESADPKALGSSDSRASISMKLVTGSTQYMTEMRPDTGVQPRLTENSRISSSAHQKIAMDHIDDVVAVLDQQGLIQAHGRPQFGMALRRDAALAGHKLDGIAGDK